MGPAARASSTKVLYSCGREDRLDRPAIGRLIAVLGRMPRPAGTTPTSGEGLTLTGSRPFRVTHAPDTLWHRLGTSGCCSP